MFTVGSTDAAKTQGSVGRPGINHTIDHSVALTTTQARTLDGGLTWDHRPIPARVPGDVALSADEHTQLGMKLAEVLDHDDSGVQACPGGLPLQHPDFALLCARTGLGRGTRSLFYYSIDRW